MALNIPLSLDSVLHLSLSLILMCKKMLFSEPKWHHDLLVTIWKGRVHRNTSHIHLGCICRYRLYKYPEYKGIAYINTPIYTLSVYIGYCLYKYTTYTTILPSTTLATKLSSCNSFLKGFKCLKLNPLSYTATATPLVSSPRTSVGMQKFAIFVWSTTQYGTWLNSTSYA